MRCFQLQVFHRPRRWLSRWLSEVGKYSGQNLGIDGLLHLSILIVALSVIGKLITEGLEKVSPLNDNVAHVRVRNRYIFLNKSMLIRSWGDRGELWCVSRCGISWNLILLMRKDETIDSWDTPTENCELKIVLVSRGKWQLHKRRWNFLLRIVISVKVFWVIAGCNETPEDTSEFFRSAD